MRTLHHLFSSPLWRNVPVALAEKVGERRPEFLALNPAGEVPSPERGHDQRVPRSCP
jgi:glutathione S-transferase